MRLLRMIPRFSLRTLVVFLLLVTSGVGLWWGWELWQCVREIRVVPSASAAKFTSDDKRVEVLSMVTTTRWETALYELNTGTRISAGPYDPEGGSWEWRPIREVHSPDRRGLAIVDEELLGHHVSVFRGDGCRAGSTLKVDGSIDGAGFSASGELIYVLSNRDRVHIYRRRRPEWWWGVFYLWEFWLTAAFAAIFVWSVVRDRRALARTG